MATRNGYQMPTTRPLRVYAFDPSAGRGLGNYMTIPVRYEPVAPGPVGRRLAVVDYDASNEQFYEAVDLDHSAVLIANGLEPSESDPRFHQQMVYAVASDTIRHFEFALGRPIRWRRQPGSRRGAPFHGRLRIFPHAFQQANAFYDAALGAVLFGYFRATTDDSGEALPGQTVFTCLSHDIVAHEMTHALVDGQREYLTDATGPDAAAFHEAFADIVALFQHFTYKDALLGTIHRTGGLIYKPRLDPEVMSGDQAAITPELSESNPMVELAREFGRALGTRSALRQAIGTPPNAHRLDTLTEPHERGAILVSAVFDAYFTIYVQRTRDLMRIARAGAAVSAEGDLHPDLAERLAGEAARIAEHFVNICIRALDYCPPVDMQFGDFLRALITADSDLVPDDPHGYRAALIKAFRLRGIIPERVRSYSEEALRWCGPAETGRALLPSCEGLDYRIPRWRDARSRADAEAAIERHNAQVLHDYAVANAATLGLDPDPARKIEAHSFHPIHRSSPDGQLVVNVVAEFLQQRTEPVAPAVPNSPTFTYRGGSTVIFGEEYEVRYVIEKSIGNQRRLQRQQGFHLSQLEAATGAAYVAAQQVPSQVNFQLVHRGV
jgi:hypothetical protein